MNYVKQDETRGKSYALRLLIHYLGDIHQPLHSMSRVDADFPAGDRGGNSFNLPTHYTAKELHAVWDSVIYEYHVNDKLVSFRNFLSKTFPSIALYRCYLGYPQCLRCQAEGQIHHQPQRLRHIRPIWLGRRILPSRCRQRLQG